MTNDDHADLCAHKLGVGQVHQHLMAGVEQTPSNANVPVSVELHIHNFQVLTGVFEIGLFNV